ncbi:MAG TPA: hypothetical protein VFW96_18840 [Thermomicrobiales bacterium]|nr:hypothetical protein [Thermomicrobiales bacterium]
MQDEEQRPRPEPTETRIDTTVPAGQIPTPHERPVAPGEPAADSPAEQARRQQERDLASGKENPT